MKILFLDQFSQMAGAQRCLLDLIPAVRARGWEAQAGVPGTGPLVEVLAARGVPAHSIPCGLYTLGHKAARDVVRFAAELRPLATRISRLLELTAADLVYVNGPRLLPAAAWAARRGPPLLFHSHNYLAARSSAALAGMALALARAEVIACCRFVTRPLAPYVSPQRLHVVYNGVAAPAVAPPRAPAKTWRVGVVGRTGLDKGQALFIEAARMLTRRGVPCEFLICGVPLLIDSAYVDRLKRLAEGLPFTFLGWQSDPAGVFAQLDLLVVPSSWTEATPRVIMEAFAAGVPVLALRRGGIPEIAEHGKTAFLLEEFTPAALAGAISGLIGVPEFAADLSRAAAKAVRERFSVERYQREVMEIMEALVSRRAASAPRTGGRP